MWAAFRATPAKPIENATRGPAGGGSPLKKRLDAGEVLQPVERKVLNRSPTPEAAAFLTLNGLILLTGELLRRKAAKGAQRRVPGWIPLDYQEAAFIGVFQSLALLAGISRSGVSMVGALVRELDHEDAATFAFLLATPVILAAGVDKLPELAAPSRSAHPRPGRGRRHGGRGRGLCLPALPGPLFPYPDPPPLRPLQPARRLHLPRALRLRMAHTAARTQSDAWVLSAAGLRPKAVLGHGSCAAHRHRAPAAPSVDGGVIVRSSLPSRVRCDQASRGDAGVWAFPD